MKTTDNYRKTPDFIEFTALLKEHDMGHKLYRSKYSDQSCELHFGNLGTDFMGEGYTVSTVLGVDSVFSYGLKVLKEGLTRNNVNAKCQCDLCRTHDKYRWTTISKCRCLCHVVEVVTGHDSLCCEFPNGKRKDNPYLKEELKTK